MFATTSQSLRVKIRRRSVLPALNRYERTGDEAGGAVRAGARARARWRQNVGGDFLDRGRWCRYRRAWRSGGSGPASRRRKGVWVAEPIERAAAAEPAI